MQIHFALILAALVQCVCAISHPIERRASVPLPKADPFHNPPEGWKSASPGDVLRSREVDVAFLQIDRYKYKKAYQLLYRTTGLTEDEPATSITTVIVPYNAAKNKLFNYNVYTDSAASKCAPSYTLRLGANIGADLVLTYQQLLLESFLDEGYITNVADYEGPDANFGVGRLEGRMVLDSIRAALNFERLGLNRKTPVVSYGYSGGALANGWAAALHPNYAPDINALGFAMGGTPANLTGLFPHLENQAFSGAILVGVTGVAYSYPKLLNYVQGRATSEGLEALRFAKSHCFLDVLLKYSFKNFESDRYFSDGANILDDPLVKSIIGDIVLGLKKSETPTAPVYMIHGLYDEAIDFKVAFKAGKDWAKHGANVVFQEYTNRLSGHLVTEATSVPTVLFFARDRFAGKPFPKGFTHRTANNGLENIPSDAQGIQNLVNSIEDIIGKQVGPGDSILLNQIRQHAN